MMVSVWVLVLLLYTVYFCMQFSEGITADFEP